MLGGFADATFAEETIRLRSGDLLVVFSDGVTDATKGENEEFGEVRLRECVEANYKLTPAGLVASTPDAVRQFSGGAVHSDDATLVALRYVGNTAAA